MLSQGADWSIVRLSWRGCRALEEVRGQWVQIRKEVVMRHVIGILISPLLVGMTVGPIALNVLISPPKVGAEEPGPSTQVTDSIATEPECGHLVELDRQTSPVIGDGSGVECNDG